jgi:hypothetical protein
LEHPWAISQRLYAHWKVALSSYFGVSIIEPVLSILYPNPNFTVNLAANLVLALAWIPGFLYIFSEFTRLSAANDALSKRLANMMVIGFVPFFGFGVAIPNSYRIAFDAFNVSLPYDVSLHYLLIAGELGGKLIMGLAAVFAREVGTSEVPEPERPQSIRSWLREGLERIGISLIIIGFVIGFGVTAFAAFVLIIGGAIIWPIGYIIRKFCGSDPG